VYIVHNNNIAVNHKQYTAECISRVYMFHYCHSRYIVYFWCMLNIRTLCIQINVRIIIVPLQQKIIYSMIYNKLSLFL